MNHAAESGLRVSGLQMRYPNGHHALKGVDVTAAKGELVVVLGSNGCGKSTFMKCVMGLNEPTAGSIIVGDRELSGLTGEDRRQARLSLAMISQNANLVKRRSVLANVCCGALGRHHTLFTKLGGLPRTEIGTSLQKIEEVGLLHLADRKAGTLSGGQAQRVAIARALMQNFQVLLADEPVASLDPEAAEGVMQLLRKLADEDGVAVICVLHQPDLALRHANRLIGLKEGRKVFDLPPAEVCAQQLSALYQTDVQAEAAR